MQNYEFEESEPVWTFPSRESTALLLTVRETMEHPGTATMETCCFPGSRSKEGEDVYLSLTEDSLPFYAEYHGELQDFSK